MLVICFTYGMAVGFAYILNALDNFLVSIIDEFRASELNEVHDTSLDSICINSAYEKPIITQLTGNDV